MAKKSLAVLVIVLFIISGGVVAPPPVPAHCPTTPYDNTVFAPIDASGDFKISLELAASGLTSPLKAVSAPGQLDRLYVVDQVGILWAVDLKTGTKRVFLDVRSRLVTLGVLGPDTFDERGFLGVAFHPNYASNGLLYTYTSEPNDGAPTFATTIPPGAMADHQNVVAEWRVKRVGRSNDVVDPKSRRELMRGDWPQFNHDGGDLGFGPDGMLYISMGDGGGADDTDGQLFIKATGSFPVVEEPMIGHQGDGNAQKLNTPLGKILRIDVNGSNSANGQYGIPADNPFVASPGAVKEIYALGLRNPFRFSFDRATGKLYVGNVGQNDIEEVELVVSGGNYGWNFKEGTLFFHVNGNDVGFASTEPEPGRVVPPDLIDPIAQYDIHHEGHSIIGGFVYRGSRIPQLRGRYVFGEFSRLFNFPSGPHNFGRLLFLQQKKGDSQLLDIQEPAGFPESIAALGLAEGTSTCPEFPITLAVLGMGEDARGELYIMGNISGTPFGNKGVVLRIAPAK